MSGDDPIRAAEIRGWRAAIEAVRSSLAEFPVGGGDTVIMHEVERIVTEAVEKARAEWVKEERQRDA